MSCSQRSKVIITLLVLIILALSYQVYIDHKEAQQTIPADQELILNGGEF